MLRKLIVVINILILLSLVLTACASPVTQAPQEAVPTVQPQIIKETVIAEKTVVVEKTVEVPVVVEDTSTTCIPSGAVKRGGEVVYARNEAPLTLNPWNTFDAGSIWVIPNIYSTLVRVDSEGTGLVPDLAKSWDISDDGTVYTFHLRDAKFSNGDPVTAEDLAYSWGQALTSGYAFAYEAVDKVEPLDDKTVKITLKEPFSPFMSLASLFTGAVVPKKIHEADPEGFGDHPIASGAWMVEEYMPGEKVVLVPNPYYYELGADCKPLPYLDKFTNLYVPESNSRVLGLLKGDYAASQEIPYSEGANMESKEGINLEKAFIYRLDYVYTNHAKPPLDKKEMRMALNYATNRESILKNVYFDYAQLPNSFMPKMNFWNKDVPVIPYDPAKAKDLLKQAGYNGEPIQMLVPSGDTRSKQTATILQSNWKDVGINAEILELDIGALWDKVYAGDYQLSVNMVITDVPDDDELNTLMADAGTEGFYSFFSWYNDPDASAQLAEARKISDPVERAKFYAQVQEKVYWDGYSVPIAFPPVLTGLQEYVKGWQTTKMGWVWWKDVWLDK